MSLSTNTNTMNENMQYTDEWFEKNDNYFKSEDLKAIKERLEHLPKMMDELNELLKNGESSKADDLALSMSRYIQELSDAIESDYQYIAWGHANRMVTY